MQKMSSYGLSTSSNIASTTSPKTFSKTSRTKTEFSGPFGYLKSNTTNLEQVAFFDAQDAKNEFTRPLNTSKYRFNDLSKDVLRRP
jgi:hypothetical protein